MRTKRRSHLAISFAAMMLFATSLDVRLPTKQPYMRLGEGSLAPLAFVKFCQRTPRRCSPNEEVHHIILDDAHKSEFNRVKREVNRDIALWAGVPTEVWDDEGTSAVCYEYALTTRTRLLELSYPAGALLLAVAIVANGEGHLVLVIVTDRGDYVLDNLQPALIRWDELPYNWIMRSSPSNPQHWRTILPFPHRVRPEHAVWKDYPCNSVLRTGE